MKPTPDTARLNMLRALHAALSSPANDEERQLYISGLYMLPDDDGVLISFENMPVTGTDADAVLILENYIDADTNEPAQCITRVAPISQSFLSIWYSENAEAERPTPPTTFEIK